MGNISFIDKLSRGTQRFLNLDCNISFNRICSSLFFPVARKNLHFLISDIFLITSRNIFEGILLVGPEPPTPKRIFVSFLFIFNFLTKFEIGVLFIWTSESS